MNEWGGERGTEDQHPEKVRAAIPEAALLQRLAVLYKEEHVEHEIKPCTAHRYIFAVRESVRTLCPAQVELKKMTPGS